MKESIEPLAHVLKAARIKKNLSQRELGKKTGFPQSHISMLENGRVDLQASSLLEISRALDLELILVPRELVITVRALMQKKKGDEQIPAYRLDDENE